MKKMLFVIMLGTVLFGDCSYLLKSAEKDFTDANVRWNKNSNNATQYSIRGQQRYAKYVECKNVERHKELIKAISEIKVTSQTSQTSQTMTGTMTGMEDYGTGY